MTRKRTRAPRGDHAIPRTPGRGIAAGYLAMLPLLLAYEAAAGRPGGGQSRSVAEMVLTLPLRPFGPGIAGVRLVLLLLLAGLAAWRFSRESRDARALGLLPLLWRILLEGAAAAICLGPLLLGLVWALDVDAASLRSGLEHAAGATPLERAAYLAGSSAWEEILFRIGIQSLLWLLVAESLRSFTANRVYVSTLTEVLSIGGAGLCFAASHLAYFTYALGPGGEPFDPGVFTWRLLAGILFGALFRWRGPGVAAWSHALFDLGLSIGAGPDVFL